MSQVADFFYERHQELDQLFLRLDKISEPLAATNVTEILEIHGQIVKLLGELTIDGQSPRSFVAKYMHFHNPVVPIYDGNAAKVVWGLVPERLIEADHVSVPDVADSYYADYVRRLLSLYRSIAAQDVSVTVRSLDYYLIWEHDNRLAGATTLGKTADSTGLTPQNQELEANGK